MLQAILIGVLVVVITYIILTYLLRPKGLPPGPIPLPLLGNMLSIIKSGGSVNNAHVILTDLAKKYGEVCKQRNKQNKINKNV